MVTRDTPRARCMLCGRRGRTRRKCCSFRASGPAPLLAAARHCTGGLRTAGRRRQPAGPSTDPLGVQGPGRARRSTCSPVRCSGKAKHRPGIRAQAQRPDEHVAQSQLGAFTRSSPEQPLREPGIPRPAAERSTPLATRCTPSRRSPPASATSTRRAAARVHIKSGRASRTLRPSPRNYLSTDGGPPGRRRQPAPDAASIVAQPALSRNTGPRSTSPACSTRATRSSRAWRGTSPAPSSTPMGTTANGAGRRPPWPCSTRSLRVRGVAGLARGRCRRAMPTITSGNTNSPGADDGREGRTLDHGRRPLSGTGPVALSAGGTFFAQRWPALPMPQAVGANRRVIDPSAQPADVASTVCVVRITGSRRPGVRKQGLGPAGFSGLALARDGRACGRSGRARWRDGS
jgi:hypothetical protein